MPNPNSLANTDEYGATISTAATISANIRVLGRINSSSDQDWFNVSGGLTTAYTYVIELNASDARWKPSLKLMSSDGTATTDLASSAANGRNSMLLYTPTSTVANAIIGVAAASASASNLGRDKNSGQYTLAVTQYINASQDTRTPATITTPTVAAPIQETVNIIETSGDQDWFKVTLAASSSYVINLIADAPLTAQSGLDPLLRIMGSDGVLVSGQENDNISTKNKNSRLTFTTDQTGGAYYLSASGVGTTTGRYRMQISMADDYGATTAAATAMTIGTPISGRIETSSDQDWFALTGTQQLAAGHIYRIEMMAKAGENLDTKIQLLNSSGTVVANNDNRTRDHSDALLLYKPETTADFYLAAQGKLRRDDPQQDGYTLTVTDLGVDVAQVVNAATAEAIPATGLIKTGNIELKDDQDWFKVALEANRRYTFDLRNDATATGLRDPYLRLLDATGAMVQQNNDITRNRKDSRITYTATQSGDFYLSAQGSASATGSYMLTVISST
ncbi:MAG: pre-peptidase C-terminal domain-containing protein [Magnetococcales bacterium]|nr:pre-peptidase C-terminal domain-containing protein [Magnetococcales bacterium]